MPLSTVPAVIPAGESLSAPVDFTGLYLVRVRLPVEWTPANITFQSSPDNVPANFLDMHSSAREMVLACRPGTVVVAANWPPLEWVRVRSGTSTHPVIQEAERTIQFTLDTKAAAAELPA